jgi:hypothetical protein
MSAPIASPLTIPLLTLMLGIIWQAHALSLAIPCGTVALLFFAALRQEESKQCDILKYTLLGSLFFLIGLWNYKKEVDSLHSFYNITHYQRFNITAIVHDVQYYHGKEFGHATILGIHTINGQSVPWFLRNKKIKIFTKQAIDITYGDVLSISNLYINPPKRGNLLPLLRNNLLGVIYLHNPIYTVISSASFSLNHMLRTKIIELRMQVKKHMSLTAYLLFDSLFLGFRSSCDEYKSIKHNFQQWGIAHYLARSGLHLVAITFLLNLLLCFLPLGLTFKNLLLFFIIVFYALSSQLSISFVRALLIFCLYLVCSFLMIIPHRLHLIQLTGFIILLINPCELFFLDFQLSFALTFFIALFASLSKKY